MQSKAAAKAKAKAAGKAAAKAKVKAKADAKAKAKAKGKAEPTADERLDLALAAEKAKSVEVPTQPVGEVFNAAGADVALGNVTCSSCGLITSFSKCRLLSKTQMTWRYHVTPQRFALGVWVHKGLSRGHSSTVHSSIQVWGHHGDHGHCDAKVRGYGCGDGSGHCYCRGQRGPCLSDVFRCDVCGVKVTQLRRIVGVWPSADFLGMSQDTIRPRPTSAIVA